MEACVSSRVLQTYVNKGFFFLLFYFSKENQVNIYRYIRFTTNGGAFGDWGWEVVDEEDDADWPFFMSLQNAYIYIYIYSTNMNKERYEEKREKETNEWMNSLPEDDEPSDVQNIDLEVEALCLGMRGYCNARISLSLYPSTSCMEFQPIYIYI